MCGICGLFAPGQVDPGVLQRMNDSLVHRGPDDQGAYTDERVGLGSRRLSIIDLSGGQLAGPVTTAFDAEIPPGTYHELRLVVAPIAPADAGPSTGLRDMATLEASVAIDGTAGDRACAGTTRAQARHLLRHVDRLRRDVGARSAPQRSAPGSSKGIHGRLEVAVSSHRRTV